MVIPPPVEPPLPTEAFTNELTTTYLNNELWNDYLTRDVELQKLKLLLDQEKQKTRSLRLKVHMLNRKLRQAKKNTLLPKNAPQLAKDIFENVIANCDKKPRGRRYSKSIKMFSIRSSFHSNKAFKLLAKTFFLPTIRTVRSSLQPVHAEPGEMLHQVGAFLKEKIDKEDVSGDFVMLLDEMSIASKVLIDPGTKKCVGLSTLHRINSSNGLPPAQANKALLFFLVSLDGKWRYPIRYELTTSFKGEDLLPVVMETLEKTFREYHIIIRGIVFDGLSSNLTFATKAGTDLTDLGNLKTYFIHPCTSTNVYIILDAVHMLKLARNFLGKFGELLIPGFTESVKRIYWEKIQELQVYIIMDYLFNAKIMFR